MTVCDDMFYIENLCPACHSGAIGFLRCNDGISVVLMCNECDAVWVNPNLVTIESAIFPSGPDFVVDAIGCSIAGDFARWAVKEEVERFGWTHLIAGDGTA